MGVNPKHVAKHQAGMTEHGQQAKCRVAYLACCGLPSSSWLPVTVMSQDGTCLIMHAKLQHCSKSSSAGWQFISRGAQKQRHTSNRPMTMLHKTLPLHEAKPQGMTEAG